MRRQIRHTADLAFEIEGGTYLDLLEEARSLLVEEMGLVMDCSVEKKKEYEMIFNEDNFFDVVNDWIYEISKRWAPIELHLVGEKLKTVFCKVAQRTGVEIKALTYHLLKFEKDGELWKTKVVFDV